MTLPLRAALQQNFTFTYTGSAPTISFDPVFLIGPIIFLVVIAIIILAAVKGYSNKGTVQRPLTQLTAFAPPPPPDTAMVRCAYCGTVQKWSETCAQCGAPMPRPQTGQPQ